MTKIKDQQDILNMFDDAMGLAEEAEDNIDSAERMLDDAIQEMRSATSKVEEANSDATSAKEELENVVRQVSEEWLLIETALEEAMDRADGLEDENKGLQEKIRELEEHRDPAFLAQVEMEMRAKIFAEVSDKVNDFLRESILGDSFNVETIKLVPVDALSNGVEASSHIDEDGEVRYSLHVPENVEAEMGDIETQLANSERFVD